MTTSARLTVLFDNCPGRAGLTSLWGFAALLQTPSLSLLFDTGSNGRVLLQNMEALGFSPASLDMLFLSHAHWDHMGGMDSVLELNPHATLVLHEGFSKHLIGDLRATHGGELILVGADPQPLAPGIFSTGVFDGEHPEHALVLDEAGVTAVISGCAHPAMARIVERASGLLEKRIQWAIGGFHLMEADIAAIDQSIEVLRALGVSHVVPTHCTGDRARAMFRRAYGPNCIDGGSGRVLSFSA